MYMPSIFNNSVFDNFDNWMDFSFPSFNQRLYGASSSQLMKTDVKETDKDYEVSIDLPGFKKDELQIEMKGWLSDRQRFEGSYIERYARGESEGCNDRRSRCFQEGR